VGASWLWSVLGLSSGLSFGFDVLGWSVTMAYDGDCAAAVWTFLPILSSTCIWANHCATLRANQHPRTVHCTRLLHARPYLSRQWLDSILSEILTVTIMLLLLALLVGIQSLSAKPPIFVHLRLQWNHKISQKVLQWNVGSHRPSMKSVPHKPNLLGAHSE